MSNKYQKAGVSTAKADLLANNFKPLTTGNFSGSINIAGPSLVATIDGVGTKFLIADQLKRCEGLGRDIVHHCINDLLCSGQKVTPIAFLDYIASSDINIKIVQTIVESIATACYENDVALLGGETAEMPDVYVKDAYDLVGTAIGIIDKPFTLGGVQSGSLVIGLYSSGLHTNGYSLVRNIFNKDDFYESFPGLGNLGDILLLPHRNYYHIMKRLVGEPILAMAHITGGGFTGNISRIVPEHLIVEITNTWDIPPIFEFIQDKGNVTVEEMYDIFNMGIGMVLFTNQNFDLSQLGNAGQAIGIVKEK